jgi:putative spermidine/putrescine transport system substrate-binding protein
MGSGRARDLFSVRRVPAPRSARKLEMIMIERRTILKGIASLGLVNVTPKALSQGAPINFVTFGGSYGEAIQQHLIKPFEAESGIKIQQGSNQSLAPLKIQVQSKNVTWDIVELAGGDFQTGLRENLFEPVDTRIVKLDNVPPIAINEYGIKFALFLSGVGYDKRKFSDANAPKSWADAWDTKRFAGMRGMSKHISDTATLESALLAAGVPIDKLYPIDVKLAFDSLKKLGMQNIFWYENNQEPVNMLSQQTVSIAQIASGRVAQANRKGAQLAFVYNQVQLNGDYLVVPKGAKNKEAAFRLMNFILNNDEAAINWMKDTTYSLANQRAIAKMSADVAETMPTSPAMKGKYFQKDDQWWGENGPKVTVRFQELISS